MNIMTLNSIPLQTTSITVAFMHKMKFCRNYKCRCHTRSAVPVLMICFERVLWPCFEMGKMSQLSSCCMLIYAFQAWLYFSYQVRQRYRVSQLAVYIFFEVGRCHFSRPRPVAVYSVAGGRGCGT